MAEVIRYVDTDASGSGNGETWTNAYTSLSAWESAEQTDLVTDGDWHHCYVRASSGTADTTTCNIDGWTTGSSNNIVIEAASGDEAVASGWSTSRYRLDTASAGIQIYEPYVTIDGLQIETDANSCIYFNDESSGAHYVKNCYVRDGSSAFAGVYLRGGTGTLRVENTIALDCTHNFVSRDNGGAMSVYNCIAEGGGNGFYQRGTGTLITTNNASFNNTNDFHTDGSGTLTINYCASDDGDGTNSVSPSGSDWANEYNVVSSGDFTPESGGNVEEGGVTVSGLTTDMAGETWNDPPTIGVLEIASSGYTLTADSGTFTLTGTAASLEMGYAVDAASGTFALTGTAASLEKGYALDADSGTFTLTGQDADLLKGYAVDADSGTFILTGTAAGLEKGSAVDAGSGTFILTGSDATLTHAADKTLTADSGTFTLTGQDVDLLKGFALDADSGTFVYTGQDASLSHGAANKIDAESGTFVLTGTAAGLRHDKTVSAEAGGFILTGSDAGLHYGLSLEAEAGAYTLTGQDVDLIHEAILSAEAGAFILTGSDATLTYGAAFIPVDRRSITVDITQGRTVIVSVSQRKAVAGEVTQRRDMEAPIGG